MLSKVTAVFLLLAMYSSVLAYATLYQILSGKLLLILAVSWLVIAVFNHYVSKR